jgi:hypothetical protein
MIHVTITPQDELIYRGFTRRKIMRQNFIDRFLRLGSQLLLHGKRQPESADWHERNRLSF